MTVTSFGISSFKAIPTILPAAHFVSNIRISSLTSLILLQEVELLEGPTPDDEKSK